MSNLLKLFFKKIYDGSLKQIVTLQSFKNSIRCKGKFFYSLQVIFSKINVVNPKIIYAYFDGY